MNSLIVLARLSRSIQLPQHISPPLLKGLACLSYLYPVRDLLSGRLQSQCLSEFLKYSSASINAIKDKGSPGLGGGVHK